MSEPLEPLKISQLTPSVAPVAAGDLLEIERESGASECMRADLLAQSPEWATRYAARSNIVTAAIVAGSLATPLNERIHHVQLSANVVNWTAPIPVGGDAATVSYGCAVVFTAPASGTFEVLTPGWLRAGGLEAISLSAGDDPILVVLSSIGGGLTTFTAIQMEAAV